MSLLRYMFSYFLSQIKHDSGLLCVKVWEEMLTELCQRMFTKWHLEKINIAVQISIKAAGV